MYIFVCWKTNISIGFVRRWNTQGLLCTVRALVRAVTLGEKNKAVSRYTRAMTQKRLLTLHKYFIKVYTLVVTALRHPIMSITSL